MKSIYLLLLSFIILTQVNAQITLNETDIPDLLPVGVSYQQGPGDNNQNKGWVYPYGTKLSVMSSACCRNFEIMTTTYPYGELVLRQWNSSTNNWTNWRKILIENSSGNVGIGTTSPDYKLDVNGTIRTRELKVDMLGADFVFEDDYQLRSLTEVEEFIQTNNHLPDVASAIQMQEEGVNQSEMNQKLLQKIEELTLYLIQQNKIMSNQSQIIDNQNKKLEDYSTRLLKLENK